MNITPLDMARQRVPSVSVLINMISQRVRQLIAGQRPYIKQDNPNEDIENIAIREIVEGKIVAEIDFAKSQTDKKL